MKRRRSILALLLVLAMVLALTACGKEAEEPNDSPSPSAVPDDSSAPVDDADGDETWPSYTIGYNSLLTGVWILDTYQRYADHYFGEKEGFTINVASCNASADQLMKDVQNQALSGEDGHLFFGGIGTLNMSICETLNDAEVYFAPYGQMFTEDVLNYANGLPYYCGNIQQNPYNIGGPLAERALEDGCRTAIILAGAIGDVSHDACVQSFTEVFEAGGGKVVGVGRDDVEATRTADDLMAAHGSEIDCVYAINMVFVEAAKLGAENYGVLENITIYASELDATGVQYVKDGLVKGQGHCGYDPVLNLALVTNALDGHKVLGEDGNPPYMDNMFYAAVDVDNADAYLEYCVEGYMVSEADANSLLYRYNPDVDYNTFNDLIEKMTLDYVIENHD